MVANWTSITQWTLVAATACLIFLRLVIPGIYAARKIRILDEISLPELAWQRNPGSEKPKLLLLGDSRIAGWPSNAFADFDLTISGYAGQTAANIARVGLVTIAQTSPQYVVVQMGGNDVVAASLLPLGQQTAVLDRAVRAIRETALAATQHGAKKVVVLTLAPPAGVEWWRRQLWGSRFESLNEKLNQKILEFKAEKVSLFEARTIFHDSSRPGRKEFYVDAVHWNDRAYRLLEKQLSPMLRP